MAVQLIQPSFPFPAIEDLARNEKGEPVFTSISHGLQYNNQLLLYELLLRSGVPIPRGAVADLGGGDGLWLALGTHLTYPNLIDGKDGKEVREEILGLRPTVLVDRDKRQIKKSRDLAELVANDYKERTKSDKRPAGFELDYFVLDPQDLATMDTKFLRLDYLLEKYREDILAAGLKPDQIKKPDDIVIPKDQEDPRYKPLVELKNKVFPQFPQVALIWCNSMFHWVREITQKYDSLANFNDVAKNGAVLALSMSAGGTARDFLEAYNNVVTRKGPYHRLRNQHGYRTRAYVPDPIGRQPLDLIRDLVEESGFEVKIATTQIEAQKYKHPRDYVMAVKIYGSGAFMAPFSHYSNSGKEVLWKEIEEEFIRVLVAKKRGLSDDEQRGVKEVEWPAGEEYVYEQLNNYIIAVKVAPHAPPETEIKTVEISDVLNIDYLKKQHSSQLAMRARHRALDVILDGDPEQLKTRQTSVNVKRIFGEIFAYAARNWIEADQNPTCRIHYEVPTRDKLVIQIDVKTKEQVTLDNIIHPDVHKKLVRAGITMSLTDGKDNLITYTLTIPLY